MLAGSARADGKWIPFCIPKSDPPVSALRVYEDGKQVREIRPIWYASGGRANFYHTPVSTNPDTLITITLVGKVKDSKGVISTQEFESAQSSVQSGNVQYVNGVCSGGTAAPGTNHVRDYKGPQDYLKNLASYCFASTDCMRIALQKCVADPDCSPKLVDGLWVDVNADGSADSADRDLWTAILRGDAWTK